MPVLLRTRGWFPSATKVVFAQCLVPNPARANPANPSPPSPEGNGSRRHRTWKPQRGCPEPHTLPVSGRTAQQFSVRCWGTPGTTQSKDRDIWGSGGWEQELSLPTLTHHRDGVHLKEMRSSSVCWPFILVTQSFTLAITKCKKDAQPCCICHDKVKIIGPFVEFYRKSVLWPSSLPFSQKPPFGLGQLVVTKVTLWKRYCMFHFGKTLYL